MSDTITFDLNDDGATEVAGNDAGNNNDANTEAGSAFNPGNETSGSDTAFNPDDSATETGNDNAPENDADKPAVVEGDETPTTESKPAQTNDTPFDPNAIGKVLVDSLAPLIDGMKQQQSQQTQAQRQREIEIKGLQAKQDLEKAQKASNIARTPQARQKAMDDYADAKSRWNEACKEAKAFDDEQNGTSGTSGNAKPTDTGNTNAGGNTGAGANVNPKVQSRIDKWMADNKAWFTNNPQDRWYNLSEAAVAESERLYLNDPDPEVRDLASDKHWAKVNEFIRQKTGRAATTKGAGGQTFTQSPVDTSAGTNVTPTTSTGTKAKTKRVSVKKSELDEVLKGFYGTTDQKKIGKANVAKALKVMEANKKNRSK